MRELMLSTKNVRTSSQGIDHFDRLNYYYTLIQNGAVCDISPITVMRYGQYTFEEFFQRLISGEDNCLWSRRRVERLGPELDGYFRLGGEYLLCDGNHRSLAFALNGLDLPSRQLETTNDLNLINQEFQERNLLGPYIMRKSETLEDYFYELFLQCQETIPF